MHEYDANRIFTARRRSDRGGAGFGVLVDVFMQGFHKIETLFLAKKLHNGCQRRISRARGVGIRHLHMAFVFGF